MIRHQRTVRQLARDYQTARSQEATHTGYHDLANRIYQEATKDKRSKQAAEFRRLIRCDRRP
jgi:hypothetical protein